MNGMVNKVIMLLIDVKVIERATLPLKKYVRMPDVVPPGQEARIIRPTLNGSDKLEKKEIKNAITGKTIIWETSPINKGLGYKNITLKLSDVSDKPTPNIIRASIELNSMSINV
jgi:hypothetical protein